MLPGVHASWELEGGVEDVAAIVKAADRFGYDHVTCSEHIAIPADVAAARGARYWDPLSVFGYLAAVTSTIRFATNVLVLGYHHPLEIAKRYGTLDQVSQGRVILGVGVGSLKEEFDLLGVQFDDRGARADEALRALRVSLPRTQPTFQGDYYNYSEVVVDPCAAQVNVPLWIGGRTPRSLRRAIELGDGWMPFGLGVSELGPLIAKAKESPAWQARDESLDIILTNHRPVDPLSDPEGALSTAQRLLAAGATVLQMRFVHSSVEHYIEQLEAMSILSKSFFGSQI